MTTATPRPAEVTITVNVDGETETFTASAVTDGDPHTAARSLVNAVADDAKGWIYDRDAEGRKLARVVNR